jgi:hypothetical protein
MVVDSNSNPYICYGLSGSVIFALCSRPVIYYAKGWQTMKTMPVDLTRDELWVILDSIHCRKMALRKNLQNILVHQSKLDLEDISEELKNINLLLDKLEKKVVPNE